LAAGGVRGYGAAVTRLRSLNLRAFALFALLIQLFLPLAVPMAMTVEQKGGASLVICGIAGDAAGGDQQADEAVVCRLCDAALHAPALLPAPLASPIATVIWQEPLPVPALSVPLRDVRPDAARPRGPPLQA
jgi:hypothetical protein